MKRVLVIVAILTATIVFIMAGGKGERSYYPEMGSVEYINDAKICAIYYFLIDDDDDDSAKMELSAFEAVFWETRNNTSGISMEAARQRVVEELEGNLQKIDDPDLKKSVGAKRILLRSLANKRGCPFIVVSGQNNLISEAEASSQ